MTWTKEGSEYHADHGDYSFIIAKTQGYPNRNVPRGSTWMIECFGPVYTCGCLPTIKACQSFAERFVKALPILESRP